MLSLPYALPKRSDHMSVEGTYSAINAQPKQYVTKENILQG